MSIHLDRRASQVRNDHSGLVLAIILAAQLMVVLDATIVNIALPDIKATLGFSSTGLSWVVDAYTLVFGGLLLLGARAGDLLGRRRTFLAGITLFTVASMAGGLATSSSFLLAARAVQGAGAAFAAPSALALLMIQFSEGPARRRAIAWYAAMSVGGIAIGLLAGGMLTQWLSWRWVFYINVPIGIAVVVGAARLLTETDRRSGRFDVVGALTSTLGMGAIVYGFIHAATSTWSSSTTIGAFVVGAVLLVGFVLNEQRVAEPITPLRLFADRNRSASYVARLLLVAGIPSAVSCLAGAASVPSSAPDPCLDLAHPTWDRVRRVPRSAEHLLPWSGWPLRSRRPCGVLGPDEADARRKRADGRLRGGGGGSGSSGGGGADGLVIVAPVF